MKIRKVGFLLLSIIMSSTFMGCSNRAVNTQNIDQQNEVIEAERLSTILPKEWVLLRKGKVESSESIVYNKNLDIINITLKKASKYDENLNDLRKACKAKENPNFEVTEMQQYSIGEGFTVVCSGSKAEELIKHRVEKLENHTDQAKEQFMSDIGKTQYVVSTWISVKQETVSIVAIGVKCGKDELIKIAQDIAENVQVEEENTDTNDK